MFVWLMIFYNRRGRNLCHLILLILCNKENIGQKVNWNIKYGGWIAYWLNTAHTRVKLTPCSQLKETKYFDIVLMQDVFQSGNRCSKSYSCSIYIFGISWYADKTFQAENVNAQKARLPLKLSVFILIKVSISIQQSLWLQTFLDSCFPCLSVSLRSCFDPVNISRPFRL